MMNYNKIAERLDIAAQQATAIPQISLTNPLNITEAYAIQSISIARRYIRGEQRVGLKMGFTSKAKMEQMGIQDMIWGRLTSDMAYKSGDELPMSKFIHPRAEPEIAFLIGKDITETVTLDNALDFVEGVAVAIEIIDSRYQNFKFSLADVVADNCSSSGFSVGEWLPANTSLQNLEMSLMIDGKAVETGNSDAILGNPLESLVAAARLAKDNGENLVKGDIILAGAATSAIYIAAGQTVEAVAERLGKCALQTVS